jgi:hypothetical protein
MKKNKILVVGYPKSGNTWLTRLTAELVGCPVKGFLYSDHDEIAVEGLERKSDFEVFKSHHQWSEIKKEDLLNSKIIYIVRDPRDVSLSGRNFFGLGHNLFDFANSKTSNFQSKAVNKIKSKLNYFYKIIYLNRMRKIRMENAVLNGDDRVHHWCRISWKNHLLPFSENSGVLILKYESLLDSPFDECQKILKYLNIVKTDNHILTAISNQSFEKKKKKYKKSGEKEKYYFMKTGKIQQWKNSFSKSENMRYVNALKSELNELGYDLK